MSVPNHTRVLAPAKPTLVNRAIASLAWISFGAFFGMIAWLIDWSI